MFKKFVEKNRILLFVVPVIVVSLIMLRYFYGVNMQVLGNDIMAHIYKVWLLSNQISDPLFKWQYWGSWDQNWYCGYTFLGIYSPLFYYLSALPVLFFNFSPTDAVKLVTFITYPLSALVMFFCSLRLTKDTSCSIIASIAYATAPAFITASTVLGNPTLLLGFVLFPLSFVFTERLLLEEGENSLNFLIASISLTLTVLSAYRNGLAYLFSIFLLLSLNYIFFRKFSILALLVIPASILLSSTFTVPALVYGTNTADISFRWREPLSQLPLYLVSFLIPVNYLSLGIPLSFFGVILPARSILKHLRQGTSAKNQRKLIYVLCSLILFVLTFCFVIPFHENIPILNNLTQGPTVAALAFFASLLCGLYLSSIRNNDTKFVWKSDKKRMTIVLVTTLILVQALVSYTYYAPSPNRYREAYDYIDTHKEGWFRVFQVPRQPTVGEITMQTGVAAFDGWFDQGATKEIEYFILRMMAFADVKARPFGWGDFYDAPEKALSALRIFNVKYVIVDSADPVFPQDVSRTIYWNLMNSSQVDLVADPIEYSSQDKEIYIFKLKEYYPLILTQYAFVIDSMDELPTFYEIVSNATFNPRNAVFLSRDNNLEKLPWKMWNNGSLTLNCSNFTIHRLQISDLTVNLQVEIDEASFLYIPISCFPNLRVTVNDVEVEVVKALPNFICVYLYSKGMYQIVISRTMTSIETASLLLSVGTLGLVTLTCTTLWVSKYVRKHAKVTD